jgi:hypothetical protein
MSGGIAQLVAVGAQDVHLVGQPEVSFFRSTYKRHTNFSQTVERQVIQGNVSNNGMSTIRFERKGDLLNYVYLMPIDGNGLSANTYSTNWSNAIAKVELLIGGQVIDEQDSTYSTLIAPTLSAFSSSKSFASGLYDGVNDAKFYPLRFSFCENWQSALPLISLQYHDVELRITWGDEAAKSKWEVYANYAYLDTQEREVFASQPQNMRQSKETTMDSTPINDIMMEPPMMTDEPRMQGMMPQMTAPQPQAAYAAPQAPQPDKKNPLNLTDEQLTALVVAACTAVAVSKPVQDRLATSIPKFLNEQGGRSMVGLAATGAVAAIVFYIAKDYIVKP